MMSPTFFYIAARCQGKKKFEKETEWLKTRLLSVTEKLIDSRQLEKYRTASIFWKYFIYINQTLKVGFDKISLSDRLVLYALGESATTRCG